jgi:lantibiotic biosynthesis protein
MITEEAVSVLCAGYEWLWQNAVPSPLGGVYFSSNKGGIDPARLAWCYGGLGVAFAFLGGTELSAKNGQRALEVVEYCLHQYPRQSASLKDVSFCHGHAGAAFSLSMLSKITCMPNHYRLECKRLSQSSIEAAVAEWESYVADGEEREEVSSGSGITANMFFTGTLGVALPVLAAADRRYPIWADLLLYRNPSEITL